MPISARRRGSLPSTPGHASTAARFFWRRTASHRVSAAIGKVKPLAVANGGAPAGWKRLPVMPVWSGAAPVARLTWLGAPSVGSTGTSADATSPSRKKRANPPSSSRSSFHSCCSSSAPAPSRLTTTTRREVLGTAGPPFGFSVLCGFLGAFGLSGLAPATTVRDRAASSPSQAARRRMIAVILVPPRGAEAALAAAAAVERLGLLPFDALHPRDHQLRDAVPAPQRERLGAQIDQQHADLAAVVAVDRPGGVDHADAVAQGEAAARAHLPLVAGGDGERQAGRHQQALARQQHPLAHDRRTQIATGAAGRRRRRQRQIARRGQPPHPQLDHQGRPVPPEPPEPAPPEPPPNTPPTGMGPDGGRGPPGGVKSGIGLPSQRVLSCMKLEPGSPAPGSPMPCRPPIEGRPARDSISTRNSHSS